MMVLLGYFLIAALTAVTTSAVIGLFLINLIIGRFKSTDRAEKERLTNHRLWRFKCFSRRRTQARLSGVLIRRR
jgi:steroid 5-alpha reductase family enzyme